MASDSQRQAERYLDLLLEQTAKTRYPSHQMLDRLERAIVVFWEEERSEEGR